MNAQTLLADIRENILDSPDTGSASTNLWSTPFLLSRLIMAEREVARRTLCLEDDATEGICVFTVSPGWNNLSEKILLVEDVVLNGVRLELAKKEELKAYNRGYDTVNGTPTHYIIDRNRIRFIPDMTTDGAVVLTVKRYPLNDITENGTPEIPEVYHHSLGYYVGALAFLKPDSQTINKSAAADNMAIFTSLVGPPVSIKEEYDRKNNENDSFNMQDTNCGVW